MAKTRSKVVLGHRGQMTNKKDGGDDKQKR